MIKSAEIQRPYPLDHGGRPVYICGSDQTQPFLCTGLQGFQDISGWYMRGDHHFANCIRERITTSAILTYHLSSPLLPDFSLTIMLLCFRLIYELVLVLVAILSPSLLEQPLTTQRKISYVLHILKMSRGALKGLIYM